MEGAPSGVGRNARVLGEARDGKSSKRKHLIDDRDTFYLLTTEA
jgi:hypothetical protein